MIEINNLSRFEIDEEFLKNIAEKIIKKKNLSIAIVGEKKISDLNKKYRDKTGPTDILSFSSFSNFPGEKRTLGEIIICPSIINKNSKKFGTTFEKELTKIIIHGILHLFGHSHKKETERRAMEREENKYLNKLCHDQK